MGILFENQSTGRIQEARDPNEIEVRTENDAQSKRHAQKMLNALDASRRWQRLTSEPGGQTRSRQITTGDSDEGTEESGEDPEQPARTTSGSRSGEPAGSGSTARSSSGTGSGSRSGAAKSSGLGKSSTGERSEK